MPVLPCHIFIFLLRCCSCGTAFITGCFIPALTAGSCCCAFLFLFFLLVLICLALCIRLSCTAFIRLFGFTHLLGTVGHLSACTSGSRILSAVELTAAAGTAAALASVKFITVGSFSVSAFFIFSVFALAIFPLRRKCFFQCILVSFIRLLLGAFEVGSHDTACQLGHTLCMIHKTGCFFFLCPLHSCRSGADQTGDH